MMSPPDDAPALPEGDALRCPDRLLTAREVAQIVPRSERTIRAWAQSGLLLSVRIGRGVFFRLSDVEALLKRSHTAPYGVDL